MTVKALCVLSLKVSSESVFTVHIQKPVDGAGVLLVSLLIRNNCN